MSLTGPASSVTVSDILALQAGIEGFTNTAEATALAAQVQAGTTDVAAITATYFQNILPYTINAMGIDALMQGGVPTAGALLTPSSTKNELQNLTFTTDSSGNVNKAPNISTAQAGINFAVAQHLNPTSVAAEDIALGIAAGDGTQNNFLTNFGGLSVGVFATTVSNEIVGSTALASAIQTFYNNWFIYYTQKGGVVPVGLTADTAAKALAFGDAYAIYIQNTAIFGTTVLNQVENALIDNAEVIDGVAGAHYTAGVALALQTPALPLQSFNQTFTLTTGLDTPPIVPTRSDVVNGTAGTAGQTLTDGDLIVGGPNTTVNIVTAGSLVAPGVATITNVGLVNITAAASNTYNALLWTGVGTVNVIATAGNNTVTGISNAPIATTFELSGGANTASLDIGYSTTGAGHLALLGSGISATQRATLDATGTAGGVNGIVNALTSATIATAGVNFDQVNLGTNAHTVTLTGTGVDNFSFGALPTTGGLTVDWHTMATNQTLTFLPGALNTNTGNAVTLLGGTGTGDSVTANGMTGTEKLTMSGVETLSTTFEGGIVFDGTNVTGLQTINANTPAVGGADLFNNMSAAFSALNVNGPVDQVQVNYAGATAPALTVTYGGNANPVTFDGLLVTNVANVTVNFNDAGGFTGPTGTISVDPIATTSLTVQNLANNADDYVNLDNLSALTNLTVSAVGTASSMFIENTVFISGSHPTVNVNAIGDDSYANISDLVSVLGGFTAVNVAASGVSAEAHIESVQTLIGSIGQLNVTASGAESTASIDDVTVAIGNVGAINITASGADSFANISSVSVAFHIGTVNVTASANDAYANIEDTLFAGSIGAVNVVASGVDSTAHIEDVTVSNDLGSLTLLASGTGSDASIDFVSVSGNVGPVNVTASGLNAAAELEDLVVGGGFGHINSINVLASGVDSFASAFVSAGTVDTASVKATAGDSFASLTLDVSTFGTVTMQAVQTAGVELNITSFQTVAGGVINASGAGFFELNINGQGGFTFNGNGISGPQATLEVFVNNPTADFLPSTINAINSHHNFIEFGDGLQETVNVGTAIAPAAPGSIIGNTFELTGVNPYFNITDGSLDIAPTGPNPIANPSEIITGFTSILNGGVNFNGNATGQIDEAVAGTAANFTAQLTPAASFTALLNGAAAAFIAAQTTPFVANADDQPTALNYYFGVVGGNGYLVVGNGEIDDGPGALPATVAANSHADVIQVVELVGVTTMAFQDIV